MKAEDVCNNMNMHDIAKLEDCRKESEEGLSKENQELPNRTMELEFEIMKNEMDAKDEFKSEGNEMAMKELCCIENCSLVAQESNMKCMLIVNDCNMSVDEGNRL